MQCCKLNCTYGPSRDGDQPKFVSCWLCDSLMHIKCAGITGRDHDKINAAVKKGSGGIKWSCPVCIEKQLDFSRMYNYVKNQFAKLRTMTKSLSSEFDTSMELLGQYEFKTPTKPCSDPQSAPKPDGPPLLVFSPLPSSPCIPVEPSPSIQSEKTTLISGGNRSSAERTKISLIPPIPNVCIEASDGSSIPYCPIIASPPTAPNIIVNTNTPLFSVVAPRKQIFISRLSADTSCESISAYIATKSTASVAIQKFNFSTPREIASFKLTVPSDSFSLLCDPSFWPPHMVVHEFRPKKRNIIPVHFQPNITLAQAPTVNKTNTNASKN